MERNGWKLLYHERSGQHLQRLLCARDRTEQRTGNANAKLLDALARAMLTTQKLTVTWTDPDRLAVRSANSSRSPP